MLALLKVACLAAYALALAGLAGWLPSPLSTWSEIAAGVLLVVHAIELPFVFRYLGRYRGAFGASVLQALLFGMLHSLALVREARA
jgi:uncharacterized protein YhhL (DUF1145 family)